MNKQRADSVWLISCALPGTSREIADESGRSIGTVRKFLRAWLATGKVKRQTRFFGSNRYTWVYFFPDAADRGHGCEGHSESVGRTEGRS